MASVEQLPSGRWRPIARDSTGHKIPRLGTYRLRSEAQRVGDEAEVTARRQAPTTRAALPATTTWGQWWDILATNRTFDSDTARTETSIVEAHLRPHWGAVSLNAIHATGAPTDTAIQDWIDSYATRRKPRGGRYSPAYIRRVYGVFTLSISAAIKKGILTASPLAGIDLPKVPRRAKPYMSLADAGQYGAALRQPDRPGGQLADYADVIDFGLETGLRPSELGGLHDDQIDPVRRVLTVRTVYVRYAKTMRDIPKDRDEREIPLTANAWAIYLRRTDGRDMTRPCGVQHYDDEPCRSDLVFRTRLGRPLSTDALWRAMQVTAAAGEMPARSPYALRRGFATRLRDAGTDVFTIMELMGHESISETHGYAQQGPDFDRRVRAALDDPAATGLTVVGHDHERGTDRGTDSPKPSGASGRNPTRRRTS